MRRSVLLLMVVALTMLVFAPVAVAQDDNPSADDRGADDRGMDDRGFDDNPGADDRGFDDNPGADDMMASPAASASAMSSATSTPSATATATATASATSTSKAGKDDATRSVGKALPRTGGPSPVALMSAAALALLVGSGLVVTRLVRRGR